MTNKNKLENFEDLLLGKFLDPIHGVIRITKLEKKIIDHPLFQRLRDIRQNTFLYKVFPSAMHSRFEHSVGVMHLSYEILKNIDLNALIYNRKNMGIDLYLDIKKCLQVLYRSYVLQHCYTMLGMAHLPTNSIVLQYP